MARILLIDDELSIRRTLDAILRDEGHDTVLCESGEEGMTEYARQDFDVVLLDLWLPGIDGLAVLDQLSKAPPAQVPRRR